MNTRFQSRYWLLVVGVLLIAVALGACGSESAPEPSSASEMTLDEYAAFCAESESEEFAEDATYGEISAAIGQVIKQMESVNPPDEVADWHEASLDSVTATKELIDTQPDGEVADPFFFLVLLAEFEEVEEAQNKLAPEVLDRLVAAGCLNETLEAEFDDTFEFDEEDTFEFDDGEMLEDEQEEIEVITGPSAPTDTRYVVEGSTIHVSWDAVDEADYYNVYYDDFSDSSCGLWDDGTPSFCEELASEVDGTSYIHTSPRGWFRDENYYWVTACNVDGCSDIDSENPALFLYTGPSAPTNTQYAWEESAILVSWDAMDGADYYTVYYDSFSGTSCELWFDGTLFGCEELATSVTGTSYVHTNPDDDNYYWVTACSSDGCSDIDEENPVKPVEAAPGGPTNARYAVEGSTIRVSWDRVPGADYYNVYYSDFFDSSCRLFGGSAAFCDELSSLVDGTSYVHTSPARDENYYWVSACNRGGCSEIDSENPAESTP